MRTKLLLTSLWRHHRRATLIAGAVVLSLLATPFFFSGSSTETDEPSVRPHVILDRAWFDRYPEEARDDLSIWVWLSSGVGLYQQGSAYRASFDIFEFVRSGRDLEMTFLQDDESATTSFSVEHCDEAPPFDLCLTLENAARGPTRYYGFSDHAAYTRELPQFAPLRARLAALPR